MWLNPGESLLMAWEVGMVPQSTQTYAALAHAYASQDSAGFNAAVATLHDLVDDEVPKAQRKAGHEVMFNRMQPFISTMRIYLLAFLLACASWLVWPERLTATARGMLLVAFVGHTVGLVVRVYLQGYAPVTNLYSSAVFVGWAAVLLGLILERLNRNGIGSAAAGAVGFTTLIIAHQLSLSGDTMEMMRAVLDSNFWLGTHVVTITIGYSGMFLAGLLAIIFILRAAVDRQFDRDVAKSLARMIYGIICFSTLFSFVGTVLGGIWADQSWGRFWGWDPKENGALLIVLWCAIVLHARWGGYVKDRGVAVLAIFGNIITAFSWFGVNLLSVGLHSYGFMESGFTWLMIFYASQIAIIAIGLIGPVYWRSPYGQSLARRAATTTPA
jgi:ABC-type transport system involved in cytochrome c biogenesis permease subunit